MTHGSPLAELENRCTRLEVSNRRLQVTLAALVISFAGIILTSAARQSPDPAPQHLVAKSLTLVDVNGSDRLFVGQDPLLDGGYGLQVFGSPRSSSSSTPTVPLRIYASSDGTAGVSVGHSALGGSIFLHATGKDNPLLPSTAMLTCASADDAVCSLASGNNSSSLYLRSPNKDSIKIQSGSQVTQLALEDGGGKKLVLGRCELVARNTNANEQRPLASMMMFDSHGNVISEFLDSDKISVRHPPLPVQYGLTARSNIDGSFQGFQHGSMFRLLNGQTWEQTSFHRAPASMATPEATIFDSNGNWMMRVDGMSATVYVRRIK